MEWGCLGPSVPSAGLTSLFQDSNATLALPTAQAAARVKWEEGGNTLWKHHPTLNTYGGRAQEGSYMVMASWGSWPGTLGQFSSRRDANTMFSLWPKHLFSFQAEKERAEGREGRRKGKWHPPPHPPQGPWRRAVSAGSSGSGWVGSRCHHQRWALTHDHT